MYCGEAASTPAHDAETESVPEAPALGEDLESPLGARGRRSRWPRPRRGAQIALGLLAAEQVVGGIAAAGEELVGHLAADELEGGQAEARLVLGQSVERTDPLGREHAQEPVTGGVDDEGVTQGLRRPRKCAVGSAT
jgi:hypothetical protein